MNSVKKMNKLHLLAAAVVSVAAAYGCSSSGGADEPAAGGDAVVGFKGNVDQAAVVESTTMMLASLPTDLHLDPYNREDPFAIRPDLYADTFAKRFANFDAYDGKTDWTEDQASAWSTRMSSANYIVVDTSKPCDFDNPHTYLEIERAELTGRDHTTCGGRMPNEDALDVTLNFLIRGPSASATDEDAIHDGVDQATKKSEATFPYLAEMN